MLAADHRPAPTYRYRCGLRWRRVERFDQADHLRGLVIPGRREAASPESITTGRGLWIPGSPPSVAPRNDQAERVSGFIESPPTTARQARVRSASSWKGPARR